MHQHLDLRCRGDFGAQATLAQVQAELGGYSDHELHVFCSASRNKRLQQLVLPADKVCALSVQCRLHNTRRRSACVRRPIMR
jgi:hypothetical protein